MAVLDLVHGERMDWDEVLFEIPVRGLDFEILLLPGGVVSFRGPMGVMRRVQDELLFNPAFVVVEKVGVAPRLIGSIEQERAPRACLVEDRAIRLPDTTIVVVGADRTPRFCLHKKGDNITPPNVFGIHGVE